MWRKLIKKSTICHEEIKLEKEEEKFSILQNFVVRQERGIDEEIVGSLNKIFIDSIVDNNDSLDGC